MPSENPAAPGSVAARAMPNFVATPTALLQRVLHAREGRIQLGAEALYNRNDCHGDSRRNQSVFNGRRTILTH
jgi:hypothetical protein